MAKKGGKIVKKVLTKSKKNPPAGGATKEVIKPVRKEAKKVVKKIEIKKESSAKTMARKPQSKAQAIKVNLKSNLKEKLSDLKLLQNQELEIIESATSALENDSRITVEKMEPLRSDRQKAVVMWTGVVFFMIVILGIWAYNLKMIFQTDATANDNNSNTLQLKELSEKMKESVGQFKQNLEEIKNINSATTTERNDLFRSGDSVATSTSTTTSVSDLPTESDSGATTSDPSLNAKEMEQLKTILEKKSTNTPELQ